MTVGREAIILAGGLGTRLSHIVTDVPKPMAPINGNPFLKYLLDYLQQEGFRKVILSVGYKHEAISGYFGNSYQSLELDYAVEESPLGTGGAIRLALRKCHNSQVFIFNGDTFFRIKTDELEKFHQQKNAEITLALKKVDNPDRFGTVILDEHSIVQSFEEKATKNEALINGGVYLLDRHKFESRPFPEKFSFEKDYLEKTVVEHCIAGYVFNTYFLDIGIPESYKKAQTDFQQF